MKLITIQNRKAFTLLLNGKPFIADFSQIFKYDKTLLSADDDRYDDSKCKAYQVLMKHYGYTTPPIFCYVVGRFTNFNHTTLNKNTVLIELNVPDEFVHIHLYDKWMYLFYYIYQQLWNDEVYNNKFKDYLDGKDIDTNEPIQAVIPYIKPEWVRGIWNIPENFCKHGTSGTINDFSWYDDLLWSDDSALQILWS